MLLTRCKYRADAQAESIFGSSEELIRSDSFAMARNQSWEEFEARAPSLTFVNKLHVLDCPESVFSYTNKGFAAHLFLEVLTVYSYRISEITDVRCAGA